MTQEECVALMKSTKTEREWRINCDAVKEAHGGDYPPYWYDTFIRSGMINDILHDPHANEMRIISGEEYDQLMKRRFPNPPTDYSEEEDEVP